MSLPIAEKSLIYAFFRHSMRQTLLNRWPEILYTDCICTVLIRNKN